MFLSSAKTLVVLAVLLTAGCVGGGHYAPVVERDGPAKSAVGSHVVKRGETLYAIAWRYGVDFRGLAHANDIQAPYTIFPGQKILLPAGGKKPKTSSAGGSTSSTNKATKARRDSAVTKVEKTAKRPAPREVTLDKKAYPYRWQWPATGKILRRYSASSALHKGIDIQGKLGEPVHAANSGKVVYAGSGLVGYGKLLIIKHDDQYLSAYGHNSRLLVKEGDKVKVGQRVAEFGDTGTNKVKLHFEIRKDGKPVNPVNVLPRKRS